MTTHAKARELCRKCFHLMPEGEYEHRLPHRPDWQEDEAIIAAALSEHAAHVLRGFAVKCEQIAEIQYSDYRDRQGALLCAKEARAEAERLERGND